MYPDLFEKCIKIVLKNEGGYGNHPADKGGETIYGIADAADGKKDGMIDINRDGIPDVKVKDLTVDQAKEIYYNQYWKPMNIDGLRDEDIALQVFDFGVNAGPGRAIRMLQLLTGSTVDGSCGPQTCRKVNYFDGDLASIYRKQRRKFYIELAKANAEYQVFLAGWLNRVDKTSFNYGNIQ
jgi:lysozyme family protein